MKTLVTGACGFIGGHLCKKLLKDGHGVIGIDLGKELASHLTNLTTEPNFEYRSLDVTHSSLEELIRSEKIDMVFHLASVVGVTHYCRDPLKTIEVIVLGTMNVAKSVQARGCKLVFASTSEIYGQNPEVPWDEDSSRVLGPTNVDRWVYATAKGLCEHMLIASSRSSGFPLSILRYFNVYGPHQAPFFVISSMVDRVVHGKVPIILDDGTQTRSFVYINDAVAATCRAGDAEIKGQEIFNIGTQDEIQISELAHLILELAGRSDMTPKTVKGKDAYGNFYDDIARRVPDTNKAHKILRWYPKTSLRNGLKLTIKWFQEACTKS